MTSTLDLALRSLAPSVVDTGVRRLDDADIARLRPAEAIAVERASSSRRREFASGRALLRELLGIDDALPVGIDRRPIPPKGVAVTLAHDHEWAIAAISRVFGISLGIDIEPTDPLEDDLAERIVRPDEGSLDAHLAFTLKEAVYKAWSSRGGGMLEHHDVRLTVDGSRFAGKVLESGNRISGRYARVGDRWIALAVAWTNT